MFDPLTIGVGAMVWLAFRKQSNTQFGIATPEREEIYRNAMEFCRDPAKLIELAKDYEKFGLKAQAAMLRKRAYWRGRSDDKVKEHEAIFNKAMESKNVETILLIAKDFEQMTATVKARALRARAESIMSGHNAEKVENDGLAQDSKAAE